MASELKLDMRSDGFMKVHDLLKLNLNTFANIPLSSHTVDEIKEVSLKSQLCLNLMSGSECSLVVICCLDWRFYYWNLLCRLSEGIISSGSASWKKMGNF